MRSFGQIERGGADGGGGSSFVLVRSLTSLLLNDGSRSYRKIPHDIFNLSVLKLDGSSFEVQIARAATIGELKQAIEEIFRLSPNEDDEGNISWSHVWGHFCLSYNGQKLLSDEASLRNFGIQDGDQVISVIYFQGIQEDNSLAQSIAFDILELSDNFHASTVHCTFSDWYILVKGILIQVVRAALFWHYLPSYFPAPFTGQLTPGMIFQVTKLQFIKHLSINYDPVKKASKIQSLSFKWYSRLTAGSKARHSDDGEDQVHVQLQAGEGEGEGEGEIRIPEFRFAHFLKDWLAYARLQGVGKNNGDGRIDTLRFGRHCLIGEQNLGGRPEMIPL